MNDKQQCQLDRVLAAIDSLKRHDSEPTDKQINTAKNFVRMNLAEHAADVLVAVDMDDITLSLGDANNAAPRSVEFDLTCDNKLVWMRWPENGVGVEEGETDLDNVTVIRECVDWYYEPTAQVTGVKYASDYLAFEALADPVREAGAALVRDQFGERCEVSLPGCEVCRRWALLDMLCENPHPKEPKS